MSDGLSDGRVVSGVGGQYNFVAMAHSLPEGRSILTLRCTRRKDSTVTSNILWNYGNTTIPRHLRDVVVTEYGVADLRGLSDQDVIAAMLNIADSRFQESLKCEAQAAGKLRKDYQIPEAYRNNTPRALEERFILARARGLFSDFPFGTDFTAEEIVLARALSRLKESTSGVWHAGQDSGRRRRNARHAGRHEAVFAANVAGCTENASRMALATSAGTRIA